MNDDELLTFDPQYPHILPQDWKDKDAPTIYEILATLNTLKFLYKEQVTLLKNSLVDKEEGEDKLRQIATNYQTIKDLLFQGR